MLCFANLVQYLDPVSVHNFGLLAAASGEYGEADGSLLPQVYCSTNSSTQAHCVARQVRPLVEPRAKVMESMMSAGHAESSAEMLMVRYKRGDRDAFSELVRRYQRPLFNFAVRYLGDREAAAEVTQETFLRVVKRSADFKHESRFSTWLFSIARHLCIDELRRRKHRRHQSLKGTGQDELSEFTVRPALQAPTDNGEHRAANLEMRDCIVRAVDCLPEEQKEVFLLRELGGIPFAEIARIVDAPENTVKSRMRYALERLQQDLCEFEEYARALR